MEYQDYLREQLTIFHYHLHSDFGVLIKVATCVAFGAVCGWLMSLLTFTIYKVAVRLGVQPLAYKDEEDDDLDLDLGNGYEPILGQSREVGDWLEAIRTRRPQPNA
ncbi:uncharacterized protein LOC108101657 [Drosophila ficusphila]|uniref:uncharacterized protein LOC108101657 n=1 Tax=Drosophila ficusphila TaxID=30025 RepID=UPI0007E87F96|nr:uncharacterized protein LOC108101657 [Drosophila ficusphila]